jgi:nitrogen fixation NifU-like protein
MNYSARLIDHFRNPRNVGMMRDPDGIGEGRFDGCGDLTRFYLRIADGRVVDARFQTYGCGPTIAAASAASELATGRPVSDLLRLSESEVAAAVDGLPEERRHAALVVADALRAAARDCLARVRAPGGAGERHHV